LYGVFYRGWFLSEELEDARDLWAVASDGRGDLGSSEEIWVAAGRSLRRMHRNGVWHNDLNLKNILLRTENAALTSYIIDLDQARLFEGAVPNVDAEQNLARLLRSIRKLDPERRHISYRDWNTLLESYHGSVR
jgi:tRNA A-37 threonylcarbamoyl transferase component Bud32